MLECDGARSGPSEFLGVENFRELSAGTADSLLDRIFPIRGEGGQLSSVSELYMRRHF